MNKSEATPSFQPASSVAILTPKSAALYLSMALSTLNNSRYSGLLGGVPAPAYIKRGKSIFYKKDTLDNWIEQFDEQTSTSQNVVSGRV